MKLLLSNPVMLVVSGEKYRDDTITRKREAKCCYRDGAWEVELSGSRKR